MSTSTATGSRPAWERYPTTPMDDWGRDHWSTLAYVETCVVDKRGKLGGDQMRCNPRRHRKLIGPYAIKASRQFGAQAGGLNWKSSYSTRLQGHTEDEPRQIEGHDDWDCVEEMIDHGLVEVVDERRKAGAGPFGGTTVYVRLTKVGQRFANELRNHLGNGGSTLTFRPSETVEPVAPEVAR